MDCVGAEIGARIATNAVCLPPRNQIRRIPPYRGLPKASECNRSCNRCTLNGLCWSRDRCANCHERGVPPSPQPDTSYPPVPWPAESQRVQPLLQSLHPEWIVLEPRSVRELPRTRCASLPATRYVVSPRTVACRKPASATAPAIAAP